MVPGPCFNIRKRPPRIISLEEYVSAGGHAYRPDLRVAIFKFFNKHLKGDTTSKVEDCAKYTPLKGRDLRAAIERVYAEQTHLPPDVGGNASTNEFTDAVIGYLG